MKNYRICALLAASVLCLSASAAGAVYEGSDFKQAVRLYKGGMYDSARIIFESLKDKDVLSEGYAALCAAKLKSDGYRNLLDQYAEKYPESVLYPQIHLVLGYDAFDREEYGEALNEFLNIHRTDLYKAQQTEFAYKRAYCDYALENYDEAREQFLAVEKMAMSDYTAPSRYAIGYIDYFHKDFDSAIKWFELAARDSRFTDYANYYILECRFNNKDYSYVTTFGPDMFEQIPEERKSHMARILAESFFIRNDLDHAREFYEISISGGDARNRSDYFFAGSILYAMKDYEGAVENFNRMSFRTDSLGQIASYQLADSYLKLKNKVAAMNSFNEASLLSYDADIQEDAFFNYAKLAFDLNQDGQPFTDYISKYSRTKRGDDIYGYMALSKLVARDYAGAVEAYDNIDVLSPDMRSNYMKANYLRANQLISGGSWRDAVPCLQAAAFYTSRRDPFNQLSRYWLAESYYNSGKYAEAEAVYEDLYNTSALYGHDEGKALPYNIAYCYFSDSDYAEAAKWFDVCLNEGDRMFRKDAGVRRADCDFIRKDYKSAVTAYESILEEYSDPDDIYPRYQLGLAYGLSGKQEKKANVLVSVRNASPSSLYYAEAMYELGRSYVELKRTSQAVEIFETLKATSKDGTYVARALIELGMISRNEKKYDKALNYYKQVVEDLPKNEFTDDAMLAIESIYQSKGEPELYLQYAESVGHGTGMSESEREQVYFNSAEQVFLSGNYQKALAAIQKYLDAYPNGSRITEAWFYAAESYNALSQKENAVDCYSKVMGAIDAGTLLERSALMYAQLSFGLEHYSDAYKGYSTLLGKARMEENVLVAKTGMMRSSYRAKEYSEAIASADALKADRKCDEVLAREADYIKAKSLLASSRRSEALQVFASLAKAPSTPEGAEAAYMIIQNACDEGKFGDVEKMVYDFSGKAGGQNYWLAKAFIALGDAFAEQDNLAQAKATFESVLNGYESQGADDDVLDNVRMRLDKLNEMM